MLNCIVSGYFEQTCEQVSSTSRVAICCASFSTSPPPPPPCCPAWSPSPPPAPRQLTRDSMDRTYKRKTVSVHKCLYIMSPGVQFIAKVNAQFHWYLSSTLITFSFARISSFLYVSFSWILACTYFGENQDVQYFLHCTEMQSWHILVITKSLLVTPAPQLSC